MDDIKGYTVYQDPDVDQALVDMIKWGKRVVIWLVFDWNKFQMKNLDNYLASKVKELVWKAIDSD